jgi:hypothetical protein
MTRFCQDRHQLVKKKIVTAIEPGAFASEEDLWSDLKLAQWVRDAASWA